MTNLNATGGVYAAALTPLKTDYSISWDGWTVLLDFLARRGCHGALLLGSTGEGPSFSPAERVEIVQHCVQIRQTHPDFKLLVGTGTPSLEETIAINQAVFEFGGDGVVVLPPYFFRKVTEEGLFEWYGQVIRRSVPAGGLVILYHIPSVTGIQISLELIDRLMHAFPDRRMGIKDSTTDPALAVQLGERFGTDLLTFSGTDNLFDLALEHSASGCITAMANLRSPDLRLVWDARQKGEVDDAARVRLEKARGVMSRFAPFPPLYKALIHRIHGLPKWVVRPPLSDVNEQMVETILEAACMEVPNFKD